MFKEGDKVPAFSIKTDKEEFKLYEKNSNKTVIFSSQEQIRLVVLKKH